MSCVEFLFSVLLQTVIKILNFYDMIAVIIITLAIMGALVIFSLIRIRELDSCIDDIYNKAFIMQGDIEEHRARLNAHFSDMAQLNGEIDKVTKKVSELHKREDAEEPAKEVEAELENLVPEQEKERDDEDTSTLYARRMNFARLRQQGADVKSAGAAVGVSYSTAKRYEQWRKDNKE